MGQSSGGGDLNFQASPEQRSRDQSSDQWAGAFSEILRSGLDWKALDALSAMAPPLKLSESSMALGPEFINNLGPPLVGLSNDTSMFRPPAPLPGIPAREVNTLDELLGRTRPESHDVTARTPNTTLADLIGEKPAPAAPSFLHREQNTTLADLTGEDHHSRSGGVLGAIGGALAGTAGVAGMSARPALMGAAMVAGGLDALLAGSNFMNSPGTARVGNAEEVHRAAQNEAAGNLTDSGMAAGWLRNIGVPALGRAVLGIPGLSGFAPQQHHN